MAHALNHLVTLESKSGNGSTFIVHVPFAGETSGSIDKAKQAVIRKAQYGFADVHVMVIENDLNIIAATTTLLDQWNCRTFSATDLRQIDDYVATAEQPPAIILADFHLEDDECGLTGVARLRSAWNTQIPAIVITADHGTQSAAAVKAAGCELLCKPIRPAELRALMQHLLN